MMVACSLDDVGVTLESGRCLFSRLNNDFPAGSCTVIQGRSGAGKSTFLDVLAGYRMPTAGKVKVIGRIGYLLQGNCLFTALTAGDNLAIRPSVRASEAPDRLVSSLLEQVGLGGQERTPTSVLSGGEQQRLQIAGLLADKCDFVLMDEPTGSLDPFTRGEIAALIRDVFGGATLVIVTHDSELASLVGAERVLTLEEGALSSE